MSKFLAIIGLSLHARTIEQFYYVDSWELSLLKKLDTTGLFGCFKDYARIHFLRYINVDNAEVIAEVCSNPLYSLNAVLTMAMESVKLKQYTDLLMSLPCLPITEEIEERLCTRIVQEHLSFVEFARDYDLPTLQSVFTKLRDGQYRIMHRSRKRNRNRDDDDDDDEFDSKQNEVSTRVNRAYQLLSFAILKHINIPIT